jgi:hypothetical protein
VRALRLVDVAQALSYVWPARAFNRHLVRFLKSKYNHGVRRFAHITAQAAQPGTQWRRVFYRPAFPEALRSRHFAIVPHGPLEQAGQHRPEILTSALSPCDVRVIWSRVPGMLLQQSPGGLRAAEGCRLGVGAGGGVWHSAENGGGSWCQDGSR